MKKASRIIALACVFMMMISTSGYQGKKVEADTQLPTTPYSVPALNIKKSGNNIKKTMHLLQSSTPENRNRVKITVYGQSSSSSDNMWTHYLRDYIQQQYPSVDLVWSNLAIPGFTADILKKLVENDMKVNYPDLIILQDYGKYEDQEEIVKYIRENTTSELMIQTPHVHTSEDTNAGDRFYYDSYNGMLETLTEKYDCDLVDIRTCWKKYIVDNGIKTGALLKDDGIHLNDAGQVLLFNLIKQAFVYREGGDSVNVMKEKILTVGSDVNWVNGELTIPFVGNRVEAIMGDSSENSAEVYVDDKRPSEYLPLYYYTRMFYRPSHEEAEDFYVHGGLLSAKLNTIPKLEDWTIVMNPLHDGKTTDSYSYSLKGSVTGDDGTGTHAGVWTSNSGTWTIDPSNFKFLRDRFSNRETYLFSTKLNGTDNVKSATAGEEVVLFSGISKGAHVLKLKAVDANNVPNIKEIRIFNPDEGKTSAVKKVAKTYKTYVKTKLYKAANTKKVLKTINKNKKLTYKSSKGNFFKVKYGGKVGFVKKSDVIITSTWTKKVKRAVKALKAPKKNAKKGAKYAKGKKLTLNACVGSYYRVKGKKAWIDKKYLK